MVHFEQFWGGGAFRALEGLWTPRCLKKCPAQDTHARTRKQGKKSAKQTRVQLSNSTNFGWGSILCSKKTPSFLWKYLSSTKKKNWILHAKMSEKWWLWLVLRGLSLATLPQSKTKQKNRIRTIKTQTPKHTCTQTTHKFWQKRKEHKKAQNNFRLAFTALLVGFGCWRRASRGCNDKWGIKPIPWALPDSPQMQKPLHAEANAWPAAYQVSLQDIKARSWHSQLQIGGHQGAMASLLVSRNMQVSSIMGTVHWKAHQPHIFWYFVGGGVGTLFCSSGAGFRSVSLGKTGGNRPWYL
jgi:hypothetical protein